MPCGGWEDAAGATKDSDDVEGVDRFGKYLHTVTGFQSVRITERKTNTGLAANIIDGVTGVVNKHGKVIVLEDDLVTSEFFLRYINADAGNLLEAAVHSLRLPYYALWLHLTESIFQTRSGVLFTIIAGYQQMAVTKSGIFPTLGSTEKELISQTNSV